MGKRLAADEAGTGIELAGLFECPHRTRLQAQAPITTSLCHLDNMVQNRAGDPPCEDDAKRSAST